MRSDYFVGVRHRCRRTNRQERCTFWYQRYKEFERNHKNLECVSRVVLVRSRVYASSRGRAIPENLGGYAQHRTLSSECSVDCLALKKHILQRRLSSLVLEASSQKPKYSEAC